MSDIKTILRDLGGIFIIIGVISLISLIVPVYNNELYAFIPLAITSAMYCAVGIPLYLLFRQADPASFKTAMVTAALGWLIISVIGMLPFWLIQYNLQTGAHMAPLSAFFESMSGWTGTGLTMVDQENLLPYSLQFWRSLIQWIGGVGVIVLTLTILARPGTGSYVLYRSEGRDQKTHPSMISTVRTIWWIFLLYTGVGIVVLMILGMTTKAGMDPWTSLNHAMTAIATGGFSVTDDSIAGFGTLSQLVVVLLMIFGGVAFTAHYDLLKGRIRKFLSDAQFQAMMFLLFLGIIALTLINFYDQSLGYNENVLLVLKESGFQYISALTCTPGRSQQRCCCLLPW